MRRPLVVLAALAVAAGVVTNEAAAAADLSSMLRSMDQLLAAEARNFSGLQAVEVKALRKSFSERLSAAKNEAKLEYGRIASGRSVQEIDRTLWSRSDRVGLPAEVKAYVDAVGGPAKTMEAMDPIIREFSADVLDGSRLYAQGVFERALSPMLGVAHARLLRRNCYLSMYVLTVAGGAPATYDACKRDR